MGSRAIDAVDPPIPVYGMRIRVEMKLGAATWLHGERLTGGAFLSHFKQFFRNCHTKTGLIVIEICSKPPLPI